ncbi:hypothetical protein H4Q26_012891 [Puccinia striiformis f. sp. tritici PST-130]|uniref:Uncharacterized protein n=1 Tax=Puccinia striiformis f. sp. tritici PST-78 TaxID=1165861 RepID=A0A0L0W0R3_9BASI|nr:hypothetical protein Pst134EB_022274 [Puccinia striiformis f. sp. tritici]KAI9617592.1 hypothetical protein H4Q26_012891 [Puccinia striiformis f. sp. tritici PST-130]KNF04870.1 hypothetical protein PSTG_01924 [Puccinia striiformis f. sp. tritici PST-78]
MISSHEFLFCVALHAIAAGTLVWSSLANSERNSIETISSGEWSVFENSPCPSEAVTECSQSEYGKAAFDLSLGPRVIDPTIPQGLGPMELEGERIQLSIEVFILDNCGFQKVPSVIRDLQKLHKYLWPKSADRLSASISAFTKGPPNSGSWRCDSVGGIHGDTMAVKHETQNERNILRVTGRSFGSPSHMMRNAKRKVYSNPMLKHKWAKLEAILSRPNDRTLRDPTLSLGFSVNLLDRMMKLANYLTKYQLVPSDFFADSLLNKPDALPELVKLKYQMLIDRYERNLCDYTHEDSIAPTLDFLTTSPEWKDYHNLIKELDNSRQRLVVHPCLVAMYEALQKNQVKFTKEFIDTTRAFFRMDFLHEKKQTLRVSSVVFNVPKRNTGSKQELASNENVAINLITWHSLRALQNPPSSSPIDEEISPSEFMMNYYILDFCMNFYEDNINEFSPQQRLNNGYIEEQRFRNECIREQLAFIADTIKIFKKEKFLNHSQKELKFRHSFKKALDNKGMNQEWMRKVTFMITGNAGEFFTSKSFKGYQ